jgi:2'-5' RNA ligase
MLKKKIFIEIAIPSLIRCRLAQKIIQWQKLPVKWMKEDNIHLTVAFVGYVDESVIPDICASINSATSQIESFDLEIDRIELGPDPADPKMVWATGKPNGHLRVLNEMIEKSLNMFTRSRKEFAPHITLGRIRMLKWDELKEKPVIDEKIKFIIPVDSVVVMESKGGGEEYVQLEECPLA